MTEIIDGNDIAQKIRKSLRGAIETLTDAGHKPGLATVLMSDDSASATYVSMKQRDCEELGIRSFHVEVDVTAPAVELYNTVSELNANNSVDGILVQHPVASHVNYEDVVCRIDPNKDVDGFHPENVGRLVRGTPRFRPCTPHGVQKLLDHTGVETEGADAVVIGRSNIVGKPLANLLAAKAPDGNATVTLCHSRTDNLAAKTREADIVVAAAGVPELVDGSMLSEGVTVIDVGYNRVDGAAVGDVDYESAKQKASAITPVPGGVGPMTRAMLMYNTVMAGSERNDVRVNLP
jgi:methylenetetrahydrofolate dehydrogenase (NADP+)/methenyltetrahydrofolate cyclohydrolase